MVISSSEQKLTASRLYKLRAYVLKNPLHRGGFLVIYLNVLPILATSID